MSKHAWLPSAIVLTLCCAVLATACTTPREPDDADEDRGAEERGGSGESTGGRAMASGGSGGGSGGAAASGGAGAGPSRGGRDAGVDAGGVAGASESADAGVDAGDACDPASVPRGALLLWLSAEHGTTAGGGRVSRWQDVVDPTRAAAQADAGKRPSLVPNVLGGRPVMRFDGNGQALEARGIAVNGLTGMTIALVNATTRKWLSDPSEWCGRASEAGCSNTYNSPLLWDETGSWGLVFLSPLQGEVVFRFGVGAAGTRGEYKPTHTRPASIGSSFTYTVAVHDGASNRLWVEGKPVKLTVGSQPPADVAPSPEGRAAIANTSDVLRIGSGRFDKSWQGDVAEVIVYVRALPEAERSAVERYLACRYFPGR